VKPLRILIVTTYGFDAAFPSRPEQLQARALVQRGHRVIAQEYRDRRYPGQTQRHEWLPGGIPVHRSSTLGFFAPEALLRMLVTERPDVVHIHHMRNLLSFQAVQVARRLGLPTLMTVHGLLHDGDLVVDRERPLEAPLRFDNVLLTPQQLLRRLARGAHPRRAVRNYLIHAPLLQVDRLIALSQHEAGLLAELGVNERRIVVIPNAVDLEPFVQVAGGGLQSACRAHPAEAAGFSPPASAPSPTARPMVLFIGQLVPRKGYDLLARAIPAVLAAAPAVRFVLVSHNRRDEAELQRLLAEGGVADRVELRGRVSEAEKLRLLREAVVVAAPSRYEGFGIPLIEALAAGAPVVTTDVPAGNEVITHERTGLLTPYDDVPALAAAIVRLLHDRALAQRMAEAGRQDVLARYGTATIAAALESAYQTLLSS
jgi:glycosyltransferase involved in cell wall biosynthesis